MHLAWPASHAELAAAARPPNFGDAASSVLQKSTGKSKTSVVASDVSLSEASDESEQIVKPKTAQVQETPSKIKHDTTSGKKQPANMAPAPHGSQAASIDKRPRSKQKCKSVRVLSAGKADGNLADFQLDDQDIKSPASERGINIVVIDPISQTVILKRAYDVWEQAPLANEILVADLDTVSPGHVLLVALKDSGMEYVSPDTWLKLREFGAEISVGHFREGYALIGVKGSNRAISEKQGGRVEIKGVLDCNNMETLSAVKAAPAPRDDGTCRHVKIFSAGKDAGNAAEFFLDGRVLAGRKASRGLNVVAIEPIKQEVIWKHVYDTFEMVDVANEALFDDMDSLPKGTIVLAGLQDSGMEALDAYAYDALHSVGASIVKGSFRTGYALVGIKGGNATAEKIGKSVSVKTRLPCLEAAKLATSASNAVQGRSSQTPLGVQDMLFVVVSDSNFYNTRVRWITDTWGQDVPRNSMMFVADKKTDVEVAGHLVETDCPKGSHDAGCCKYGHAVYAAAQRAEEFEWFYFADDDVYVRPDAMAKRLGKRRVTKWPVAKGLLGCGNEKCGGICGGGGFMLNRKGLQTLVSNMDKTTFVGAMMSNCTYCSHWGDLAISRLIEKSGLKLEMMKGLHPWRLQGQKFKDMLFSGEWGILTMHYMRTFSVLRLLHRLFSPKEIENTDPKATGKDSICITWKGRKVCGRRGTDDIIWQ